MEKEALKQDLIRRWNNSFNKAEKLTDEERINIRKECKYIAKEAGINLNN